MGCLHHAAGDRRGDHQRLHQRVHARRGLAFDQFDPTNGAFAGNRLAERVSANDFASLPASLTWAKPSLETPYGHAAVQWRLDAGELIEG